MFVIYEKRISVCVLKARAILDLKKKTNFNQKSYDGLAKQNNFTKTLRDCHFKLQVKANFVGLLELTS